MPDQEPTPEENLSGEFPITRLSIEAINFWSKSITAQIGLQKQTYLILKYISGQLFALMCILGLILGALIVLGVFVE
jgi:hypothetical protein